MGIKAEQIADMHKYALICLEEIELLHGINKSISKSPQYTDKHFKIMQENVALMINLQREFDDNINY